MNPPLIIIVGPTASGKSDLAVKLAKKFDGEIISADSRQVYRGMDIGTGKITNDEMKGIPHYLLDVADPKNKYNVVDYVKDAKAALTEISARNKIPIIVGGTGFYIEALVDGVVLPEVPPNENLREDLSNKSAAELFSMIEKLDPARASTLDPHNSRRLIRAIEIVTTLGNVPAIKKDPLPYTPIFIGLNVSPEVLRKKIHVRLMKRLSNGMIDEVKRLHAEGLSWQRMEELGLEYRYLAYYLQNKISKVEMIEKLSTEIWRYAKRQLTWFKRDKRIHWIDTPYLTAAKKIISRRKT
jgi:tRNA dimethylallyltransferase